MSSASVPASPRALSAVRPYGRDRAPADLLLALVRANVRYWHTVDPLVREQLGCWRERAMALEDPRRRALALAKLRDERFNPQLAATLATQAPRALRGRVAEAIVAAQVAYDYRDALQERRLDGEDEYARELDEVARRAAERLPRWRAVADVADASAARCAEAQSRGHAAIDDGDRPLREWARREAAGTGLGWPEWLAGAQASVLAGHALTALSADVDATPEQAAALDRAYVSIGALTMLDSLIDRERAARARELDYARWYENPEQMGERLAAAARDALWRARLAPNSAHHAMTLTGVVAYYASAPQAREPQARAVFAAVKAELGASLVPAAAVMRAWRVAKRARRLAAPLLAAVAVAGLTAKGSAMPAVAAAGSSENEHSHAARSLRASDEAHLRYVSASGSILYEIGHASGTLPGSMRVYMRVSPTFSGSFRIYAAGGAIYGHGSATPHGVGVYESFAGSLSVVGGSGRFRHAAGTAKLYGTFNRNTYALLVQTEGNLHY